MTFEGEIIVSLAESKPQVSVGGRAEAGVGPTWYQRSSYLVSQPELRRLAVPTDRQGTFIPFRKLGPGSSSQAASSRRPEEPPWNCGGMTASCQLIHSFIRCYLPKLSGLLHTGFGSIMEAS
jgi:hypothetical protein